MRVLIVEDNPGDARLIREILIDSGHPEIDLEFADSVSTALAALGKRQTDVALIDLSLPDSKGLQTFVSIQDRFPQVPLIILTGLEDEAVGFEAVTKGAQDYLVKGKVETDLLTRSLRYAVQRKRSEMELQNAYVEAEGVVKQLRELDELKSDFLNTMSHELRTPLTFMQGCSSTLSQKWDSLDVPTRRMFAGRIHAGTMRLAHLVDQLLDLSRLESHDISLTLRPCNLQKEIARVLEDLDWNSEESQVTVDVEADLFVMAEPNALSRILTNLFSNARKFSPEAFPIHCNSEVTENGRVVVHVEDRGIGMRDEELTKVFDRFYRAHRGNTAREGTGIGLAIAKEYSRAMNGDMWAKTRPEGGTIFSFTLALAAARQASSDSAFK